MKYNFTFTAKNEAYQKEAEEVILSYVKRAFTGGKTEAQKREEFNNRFKGQSVRDILRQTGFFNVDAEKVSYGGKFDAYDFCKKRGRIAHTGYTPSKRELYNFATTLKGLYVDLDLENGTYERLDTDTGEKTIITK